MLYRIVLALHVISIISWMAGLLYLFRLFVYHVEEREPVVRKRLDVMAERLYRIITVPAMLTSLAFGITMLALNPLLLKAGWMHGKLTLVLVLIGVTVWGGRLRGRMDQGIGYRSKTLRIINEIPTLLMIGIVFLVILKL